MDAGVAGMNWPTYLMGFARHAATKSKDTTKVGAVLVGPDGEVRLTAYNGPPKGVQDLPERFERPAKYLYASHAEANLVAFAAREGIRTAGCSVYVTHHPCSSCARSLIQAGIRCVVVGDGTTSMPAQEFEAAAVMFREAGVEVTSLPDLPATAPANPADQPSPGP
jgi:dCMP deaminase